MNAAKMKNLLLALVIFMLPAASHAADSDTGDSLVSLWPVFTRAATEHRSCPISPAILAAVAFVESGLDYSLLRVESKAPISGFENSRCLKSAMHDADRKRWVYVLSIASHRDIELLQPVLSHAAGYDAGLMQINRWWVKKLNLSLSDLLLSPEKNARTGCMILAEALDRCGNMHEALEIYHHGRVGDGRYTGRVIRAMRHLVAALERFQVSSRREG